MEAVLIVGAGPLQVPMMQEAQTMGLAVIATDANPGAPGATLADVFYPIDTYDVPGHRTLGQMLADQETYAIRGVVTCGADVAPSVAAAAQVLGCRGVPLEVAQKTHSKSTVRHILANAGLACFQPLWKDVSCCYSVDYVRDIIDSLPFSYPMIMKPFSERASRGVTIVRRETDEDIAWERICQHGYKFLIEEYLHGTEHSVELIFGNDGEVLWFNIVDRVFDYRTGIPLELGHINPTRLDAHAQQQILLMTLAAARALGVQWGPWKIDCMMTAEGPKILECTARLSGGWDSQWSSPATGRHPMRLLLQLACGLPLEAQSSMDQAKGYAAVASIMPQTGGCLAVIKLPFWGKRVSLERLRLHDQGVIYLPLAIGNTLPTIVHNAGRVGFVMARSQGYDHAWETVTTIAQEVVAGLQIDPTTNLP